MTEAPTKIRALQSQGVLELAWNDGTACQLPYKFLRGQCPCAGCVNEMTGERMIDVDAVPESIQPLKLEYCGNYALKIDWNDGHNTGLFTWERLHALCRSRV